MSTTTIPLPHESPEVATVLEKIQDARDAVDASLQKAREARARLADAKDRLADAQAAELLGESSEHDAADVKKEITRLRKAAEAAEEDALQHRRVIERLRETAPDRWQRAHDALRQDAFEELSERIQATANAGETAADAMAALKDFCRANRAWVKFATDSVRPISTFTANPGQRPGSVAGWIPKAHRRAERLREKPRTFSTGVEPPPEMMSD